MFGNTKKIQELEQKVQSLEVELESKNQELDSNVSEVTRRLDDIDTLMEGYKKHEEEKKLLKDSDEPWADFTVEMTEQEGRVKVKFDWNKAMIRKLKEQGFRASTEEDMISMLFAGLIGEHGEMMSKEELDEIRNA